MLLLIHRQTNEADKMTNLNETQLNEFDSIQKAVLKSDADLEKYMDLDLSVNSTRIEMRKLLNKNAKLQNELSDLLKAA